MENIAIIYWSGTGNTESMANAIAEGISAAGGTAAVMSVDQCSPDQVNTYLKSLLAVLLSVTRYWKKANLNLSLNKWKPHCKAKKLLCLVPMTGEPESGWRTGVTA